jgi:hypothetical protein
VFGQLDVVIAITIGYLVTAILALFFTLGSSQAMKGAWLEDMLSLAPPIAFLVANRVRYRRPPGVADVAAPLT